MGQTWAKNSDTEYILSCTVSQEEFAPFIRRAMREFSNEIRMSGFRPGKIPPEIVEREVGKERILERASRLAVIETYTNAVQDQQFEIVDAPRVELSKVNPDTGISYTAAVPVLPPAILPDYQSIVKKTEQREISVSDEEFNQALRYLRASRAQTHTVSRPAQKGDLVEVDFTGNIGGKPVTELESKHHPCVVGDGRLLPEFEAALVGMSAGESKCAQVRIPDTHRLEAIRGKNVDFDITLNIVQSRTLPEPDDEFARSLGSFQNFTELSSSVRDGLVREKKAKEHERFRIAMLDDIAKEMPLPLPETLINRESDKMIKEFERSIDEMGLDRDTYFKHIGKEPGDLKKNFRHDAEKRVLYAIILRAIAKKEGISVSDEEVRDGAKLLRNRIDSEATEEKLASEDVREYTRGIIRNEKVFELLERYHNHEFS